MIQVNCVAGQACCSVRTIGTTWQVSPSADSLRMQTLRGGWARGNDAMIPEDGSMSGRWPLGSEVKRGTLAGGAMLYDASRANNFAPAWFDPRYWQSRGELEGRRSGRGAALLIRKTAGNGFVLRHYRRGGLMARLSADKYFWRGEDNTAPVHGMAAHLPPASRRPARARADRRALSSRRPDLHRRPDHRAPADGRLTGRVPAHRRLSIMTWILIGRCVRRFHDLGVCHADLNAHNILLSEESVYLIDFDRCQLRGRACGATRTWCACAARWRRSPTACRAIASAKRTGTGCSTAIGSSPANSR